MIHWTTTLGAVLSVFGVIAVGGLIRKLEWLSSEADRSLLQVIIRVLMPCLAFSVVTSQEGRGLRGMELVYPPLVGVGTILIGFVVAALAARYLGRAMGLHDDRARRTFALVVGVYNYGYIPIPLVKLLFDDATLGVLLLHNVGVELALWTAGVMLLSGGLERGWWRNLISPPAIAILLGVFCNYTGLSDRVPDALMSGVQLLGDAAIPMGLLIVGATMADHWQSAGLHRGGAVMMGGSVLRLAVLPLVFLLIAYLCPFSPDLKRVMVVEAAMPAAVFPIVMARHYHGDPSTALRVVVATSVIGLFTLPLWIRWGLLWVMP
jgi:hypothetical protein